MFVVLVFLLVGSASASWWNLGGWIPPVSDTSCEFDRGDALECLENFVDVAPKDGGIRPNEVTLAIKTYATYPIILMMRWLGGVKQVFHDCDYDHNGVITPSDWIKSAKTCMPLKSNMCQLEWFCKRAGYRKKVEEEKSVFG